MFFRPPPQFFFLSNFLRFSTIFYDSRAFSRPCDINEQSFSFSLFSSHTGGFVFESNIMKRQRLHFDEMSQHMSDEAKRFYGTYFHRYAEYFSQISPTENEDDVKTLSNLRIYEMFDSALLDVYPSAVYRLLLLLIRRTARCDQHC